MIIVRGARRSALATTDEAATAPRSNLRTDRIKKRCRIRHTFPLLNELRRGRVSNGNSGTIFFQRSRGPHPRSLSLAHSRSLGPQALRRPPTAGE
jgi:hypothetical protein